MTMDTLKMGIIIGVACLSVKGLFYYPHGGEHDNLQADMIAECFTYRLTSRKIERCWAWLKFLKPQAQL